MEHNLILSPVRKEPLTIAKSPSLLSESTDQPFIQANTIESSLDEIQRKHIIPVFVKDNEPLISQSDFISAMAESTADVFHGEQILNPSVRLSHPIKGRIPEAKDKPAQELQEHEKTLYFERMAFVIEIPSIQEEIDGNPLSLTLGGVKSYNLDNLSAKKGSDEHFTLFIGFKNRVCTNLCVSTDGLMSEISVRSLGQLKACVRTILENFNAPYVLHGLREFSKYEITDHQFAHLVGRCRMYPYLPKSMQSEIPQLLFGDTQLGMVVRDYYRDGSFCRSEDGMINLWKLYNLFTGANKSTYIDQFLQRSVNAFRFVQNLKEALNSGSSNWYLG
jgi:hypothetical protein